MAEYRVVYTPEAEAQLVALYRYIAGEASPDTARRFTDETIERREKLSLFPNRGAPKEHVRGGLRILTSRRVTIAYIVESAEVIVAGIFYGGQDCEAILGEP